MSSRARVAIVLAALLGIAANAGARVFLTTEEALRLAFPGCTVEKQTTFLTTAQVARARELSGVEVPSALVVAYAATCGGRSAGTAYFDAHTVRTLPETLLVVVDPQGKVARVEVLSFEEPEDYLPRGPWYAQFVGHGLDADLELDRAIRRVSGASLTARSTTQAVRRVLAIDRVRREGKP